MKKKMSFFAIIIAALVFTGCTTTRTFRHTVNLNDPYAKASLTEINKHAQRWAAHVTLADGRTVKVRSLLATPDSMSWFDAETGLFERVGTGEVQKISFLTVRKDAWRRFAVGALAGAAVGAVIGFSLGDDQPCRPCEGMFCDLGYGFGCISLSAGAKAVIGATILAGPGGGIGVAMGTPKVYRYRFETPAPVPPVVVEEARQRRSKRP